jgi:Bifunctional DNA primase/polymerase, N-terminal
MTPEHVRLHLLKGGYCPLPLNGKIPALKAWQKRQETTREEIAFWSRTHPAAQNTGVLTRLTPTLDIDILDPDAAKAIEDLARDRFGERGVVIARFGNRPKRAIPFRTTTPFVKIAVTFVAADGAPGEKIEFLGDGQQVVVDGVHPDTGRPYEWFDGSLLETRRDDLPLIDAAEAQAFLDDSAGLLVTRFGYHLPSAGRARVNGPSDGEPHPADWRFTPEDLIDHDRLAALAMRFVRSGMNAGACVNFLRSAVTNLANIDAERRQRRLKEIPAMVESAVAKIEQERHVPPPDAAPLTDVHKIFRKWLGEDYDFDVLDVTLAAAASERLSGDPLWLLIISGPGNAKTETVQALSGAGAHVTSTIASEGALLSATPRRDKGKRATGGLLRKLGDRGVLVLKDVTSILSADRNTRACVLAAIREIYDGRWERNVGTDGGQTLTWTGRIVIVGAVTTAWDAAHAVIASMGDRFVIIRASSTSARTRSAIKAIRNTGNEIAMRKELAHAAGGLINAASKAEYQLSDPDIDRLVKAADIVTWARTGVERDYKGDVIDAHAPEMPTRFAKQLTQLVRGAVAIGMSADHAMRLAIRCARDSIPPLRREILLDIATNPGSQPREAHRRIGRPRDTVRRELEALYMLRLLKCEEIDEDYGDKVRTRLHYSLADKFDLETLRAMSGLARKCE